MYNSTTQGVSTGEMSRYLIQMKYGQGFSPDFRTLHIVVGRSSIIPDLLPRNEKHLESLLRRYTGPSADGRDKIFSPSAVNTWLTCRMKFYYRYVCGIAEEDKLEKEIDQRRFGNILHKSMEELYKPVIGKMADASLLKTVLADPERIRGTVIQKTCDEMRWSRENVLAGKSIIIIDVLVRYIREIIEYDIKFTDLVVHRLEEKTFSVFDIDTPQGSMRILAGGITDRVDAESGLMRVVDYKTGTPKEGKISLDKIFDETVDSRSDAVLQILLYCNALRRENPGKIFRPAIYWVQKISSKDFSTNLNFPEFETALNSTESYNEFMDSYEERLKQTLTKIFSSEEHFTMTPFLRSCINCPYRQLCRR